MKFLLLFLLLFPFFANSQSQLTDALAKGQVIKFDSYSPYSKVDTLSWTITASRLICARYDTVDSTAAVIFVAENYLQGAKAELNTANTLLQVFQTNIGPFFLLYRATEGGFVELSHDKLTWIILPNKK